MHELFEQQAAQRPGAVAVVCGAEEISYGELNAQANHLARYLRGRSVGAEARVGVCVRPGAKMLVGLLGVLKAGGAYMPFDPAHTPERLRRVAKDAGLTLMLTLEELRELSLVDDAQVVYLDGDRDAFAVLHADEVASGACDESTAYVMPAPGPTGRPECLAFTHRNAVNFFAEMDRRLGKDPSDVWLTLSDISLDSATIELLWMLSRGVKVIIGGSRTHPVGSASTVDEAAARGMDFSLFYFATDDGKNRTDDESAYHLLIEGARFADQNGFTAIWTPERHFHAFGGLYPNPAITSAAVATITRRIQIRAGSVVLPLHDPVRVAEDWSMVDNLSRGRVAVSFASGWHAHDFVFAPDAYGQRHELMYRHIESVRKLWRGEAIVRRDGGGNEYEARIRPRPFQPELPFWITAAYSPETFQSAGKLGANLLTHLLGQTVDELAEKIRLYRTAWRERGHGHGDGFVTLMLHTFVGQDHDAVRKTVREPFTNYLESSISLLRHSARSLGHDLDSEDLTAVDMQAVLEHAFNRYFESSALFGTPQTCLRMINRLKAVGVDEVACLIDFGVEAREVISNLRHLDTLRRLSNPDESEGKAHDSIAAQVARHQVTHLLCRPAAARTLLSEPGTNESSRVTMPKLVDEVEALPLTLAWQLRATQPRDLYDLGASVETDARPAAHPAREFGSSVQIGRPLVDADIRILDRQFRTAPPGVQGEVYLGGPGVARGYLSRPALTAERFVPDPDGGEAGARLYRTGNVAAYLPGGGMKFSSLPNCQVKVHGHGIEVGEIESALAGYEGLREAAFVAREDAGGERQLVAYLIPEVDSPPALLPKLSTAEAERLLDGRPHFKLPNGLVVAHPSGFRAGILYREIFENELYLRHGITVRDGDCVFDVGANIGMFTLFVNQKFKDLTVYAFEPIPPTFDFLRANAALYGLNVKLFNAGVSNAQGAALFTFYPQMPGLSGRYSEQEQDKQITKAIITDYLRKEGSAQERAILTDDELDRLMAEQFQSETYPCPLLTLSGVIAEHSVERIDLLKIDVEKSELDVLSGLRPEDWRKIRQIVIEVDTPQLLTQISALLERYGYDFETEELVSAGKTATGPGVHVFMVYARRRDDTPSEPETERLVSTGPPRQGRHGRAISVADVQRHLQDRLPQHMMPSSFVMLREFPLTPDGTVDWRSLPDPTSPASGAKYVEPGSPTEKKIAAVWREVLGIEQVRIDDSFFMVGGTSLLLVQVNSKLRAAFDRSIPIAEMFRHPSIRALAQYLDREQDQSPTFEHLQSRASKQAKAMSRHRRVPRK
jgi:natural product biosynthesis luciferase-like monooxygenase protein/FkbM family methyltransferase